MSKLAKLNGNILTIHTTGLSGMLMFVRDMNLPQFSAIVHEDSIELSFPLTKEVEEYMPGIVHGAKVRAAEEEQLD